MPDEKDISRRRFLQYTGLVTGAAAALGLSTVSVAAEQGGSAHSGHAAAASNPLNRARMFFTNELDFSTLKLLTFDVADEETFRCLAACKKAIKKGGLGPCAANGANEEAVKLFLEDKIGFLDIGRLVEAVVDSDSFGGDYTLADVYECDKMARAFVRAHL